MQTAVKTKNVIVIETNEKDAQESARSLVKVDGVSIALLTPSPAYALEKAKETEAYLIVIDEKVEGIEGFCQEVTSRMPETKVVITSDRITPELEQKARQWGAKAILPKPLNRFEDKLPLLFEEKKQVSSPPPVFEWSMMTESGENRDTFNLPFEKRQDEPSPFFQDSSPVFREQSSFGQQPFDVHDQQPQTNFNQPMQTPNPQNERPPEPYQQSAPYIMQGQYQEPFHPHYGGQGGPGYGYQMPPIRPKMIVTVYSPKGGVGKTTISLNLAVALRKVSVKYLGEQNAFNVGLADFDVDFGDVAASLQLVPRGSVVDWPKDENFDFEYVKNLFTYHTPSQVAILAGPERPEMEFMLDQEQATRVIDGMHKIFDIVVVDMGYSLRKSSLLAMSRATHPLFITTPDTPAVRDMTRAKRSLEENNINFTNAGLIINKIPRKGRPPLSIQEVKRYIGLPVVAEISEDPMVLEALSEGTPLMLKDKSVAGQELERLAHHLLKDYLPSEEQKKKGFFSRLFGRD
jgi:MinD-like ATPase involved in chromosome partitioning or flagellar assembly